MVDFTMIATLLYTIGIKEENIKLTFVEPCEYLTSEYINKNIWLKIEISQNYLTFNNCNKYLIKFTVNENEIYSDLTDEINIFYSSLLKTIAYLIVHIKCIEKGPTK